MLRTKTSRQLFFFWMCTCAILWVPTIVADITVPAGGPPLWVQSIIGFGIPTLIFGFVPMWVKITNTITNWINNGA